MIDGQALRSEFVVAVTGKVVAPRAEAVNPKMATGEIEVAAVEVRLLNDAKTPPFPDRRGPRRSSEEVRLRYRYLDLRRPRLQQNLIAAAQGDDGDPQYFDEQGFSRSRRRS